jgi:hypothetical protein
LKIVKSSKELIECLLRDSGDILLFWESKTEEPFKNKEPLKLLKMDSFQKY